MKRRHLLAGAAALPLAGLAVSVPAGNAETDPAIEPPGAGSQLGRQSGDRPIAIGTTTIPVPWR